VSLPIGRPAHGNHAFSAATDSYDFVAIAPHPYIQV
jgi:hypothetical protein